MTITAAEHGIWCAAAVLQLTARTVQHSAVLWGDGELENTIDLFNPGPSLTTLLHPSLRRVTAKHLDNGHNAVVKWVQDTAHRLQCCRFRLQCEVRYLGPRPVRKCKGLIGEAKVFPHMAALQMNLESHQKPMTSLWDNPYRSHLISF